MNQQPNYQQPQQPQNYQQPYTPATQQVSPQQSAHANSVLRFGILGLAFACSFFLSFLGIIFSAIGLSKAGSYVRLYSVHSGKTKTGKILSIIGLIGGICATIGFVIWLIAVVIVGTRYGLSGLEDLMSKLS